VLNKGTNSALEDATSGNSCQEMVYESTVKSTPKSQAVLRPYERVGPGLFSVDTEAQAEELRRDKMTLRCTAKVFLV
jgi:hypothetical protein